MTDFWTTADEIHALPGTYVLAINLSELVAVSIYRKPSVLLAPGCYLYCGLAKITIYGPKDSGTWVVPC